MSRVSSGLPGEPDADPAAAAVEAGGVAEGRLRRALDAAHMGTWEWDVATGSLNWAGHLEEIHGMAPGTFDGRFETYAACIHPDDRERVLAEIGGALERGGDFHTEFRVTYPDGGGVHWVAGEGRAYRDADGRPERMVGVGWDITAAKRVEEELRAQRELLRAITDNADSALAMLDTRGCVTFVNPAFTRITGYAAEEVHGRPLHDALRCPPVERPSYGGREPLRGHEDVFVRRDGSPFPVVCAVAPLEQGGAAVGCVLEFRDVTREKEAEAALHARAEREALVNRIGEAVRSLTDPEAVLAAAVRELGRVMGADRCYFAEYDVPRDWARVGADWHRPDLRSISGTYRTSTLDVDAREMFGGPGGLLRADDLEASAPVFSPRAADTLRALGLRAILGVALFENGLPVAALVAAMADAPRAWTPAEVELVRAAATLVRSAMEDARVRKREHDIAERLQAALQPSIAADVPGLEVDACYQPALSEASIGGDFYDVFALDERRHALVVADLSGKGLAAAAQVATVRHMLRALLYRRETPLARSVGELNAMLAEHRLLNGFATLFVGEFDAERRTLTYVNAGQEPGLLRRAASGAVEELGPTVPVLGGFVGAEYAERVAALRPGDVLALFTDGLPEARRGRKDLLGLDGVTDVFVASTDGPPAPAEEVTARVMRGVERVATPAGIRDDVCLLVARVSAAAEEGGR